MSTNLHGEWDAYQTLDQLGDPWAWALLDEMVDSSFTLVPIQRNTRDENTTIMRGSTPDKW